MGKHKSHRTPTCKKCGEQHFNFARCAGQPDAEDFARTEAVTAPAVVIHRHEQPREWGGITAGSFAGTGDFRQGAA